MFKVKLVSSDVKGFLPCAQSIVDFIPLQGLGPVVLVEIFGKLKKLLMNARLDLFYI